MPCSLSRRDLALRLFAAAPQPVPVLPSVSGDQHCLARATFGADPATLAELQNMGRDAWLAQQLEPGAIDDSAIEATLAAGLEPWRSAAPDVRLLGRAIYSKRQLGWRMAYFLNNHFSTFRGATAAISESVEDEVFFKYAFTDFATVLRASATSPAMIDFLDSQSNVAASPNENYARELMELHTLGVDGGYTEADVAEAARVFTGWSRVNVLGAAAAPTASYFRFVSGRHDAGPKSLSLGWSTPGIAGPDGYLEGYSLLDFLAAHPKTAMRFCEKLCRYFISDQPSAALQARVRQVFVSTGGNLKATVYAVFGDPEFAAPVSVRAKVLDGFEFVANCVRRLQIPAANLNNLNTQVASLRAQPHQNSVPTGYDELGDAWRGSGNVLSRWKFADDLVHNRIGGVQVPWSTLFPTLPQGGAAWVTSLLQRLVDGDVPATTELALTVFMDGRLSLLPSNPTPAQVQPHLRDLASLILRLPETQLN